MALSVLMSILMLWTLIFTNVQQTSGNNVSDSRVLQLEQTMLNMQSQFQVQEQKYAAVLSSVLSKLSSTSDELGSLKQELDEVKLNVSTSDELSSVKSELRNVKSEFEILKKEHLNLTLKMKKLENGTVLLKSNLTASENNLQKIVSEQVQLSSKLDNISNGISQLKASDNSDSTCSMTSSGCPPGFIIHGSSCYLFSRNTATFLQAHSTCQFLSSYLAVITSSDEDNFVKGHLSRGGSYFIGGSDLSQEGTWTWGCPLKNMTYTNWAHGHSHDLNSNSHCLAISVNVYYQWAAKGCDAVLHYVCERKAQ